MLFWRPAAGEPPELNRLGEGEVQPLIERFLIEAVRIREYNKGA